mgnify:CR=1 FL=1
MIESAANAKFKRIQKLMKQARARKKEGVFGGYHNAVL